MLDDLIAARQLADRIRYSGDVITPDGMRERDHRRTREHLYQHGLRISPDVTPDLAAQFTRVCERLRIPRGAVDAFVVQSASVQAECFVGSENVAIIRFSSSLIDVLDPDEFGYVVGHELAHFLLRHDGAPGLDDNPDLERFMLSRAAEISADRIGYLGIGSLDVAIRALMKTVSGLPSRHLRFDVGSFLAQLKQAGSSHSAMATHPTIAVRCRALLWYSLADGADAPEGVPPREQIAALDARIKADFRRYVDGPVHDRISKARENMLLWSVALEMIRDGTLDRAEQEVFAARFGGAALESLRSFVGERARGMVEADVRAKLAEATSDLESMTPRMFAQHHSEIGSEVRDLLSGA